MQNQRISAAVFTVAVAGLLAAPAVGADVEAGADLATQCAGCHGAAGISTGDGFPNLAAQKAGYVAAQLRAFRCPGHRPHQSNVRSVWTSLGTSRPRHP